MNTNQLTAKTEAPMKPARIPAARKEKTAAGIKTSAPAQSGLSASQAARQTEVNAPSPSAPAPATITLAPSFIALADQFGMVPERLAERVISAFAETRPARIVVKARASSGQSGH